MALILDGTQYARAAITSRNSANPWSFFSYVYFSNLATGANQSFFTVAHGSDVFKMIGQRVLDATDTIVARFRPGTSEIVAEDTGLTLVTGTWYRVFAQWDEVNKEMGIQIDNRAMVKATGSHIDADMTDINIGCGYAGFGFTNPADFLYGRQAHNAQWNSLLSAGEISDLMDGTSLPDEIATTPDHYKPFINDQSGGIGTDYTLFGSPTIDSEDPHSTGVTLVIQDASHAQTADNLALVQANTLVMQDATHSQTADNLDLSQAYSLVIQEALHGQTVDNVDLVQANSLAVQEAAHAHTSDNLDLVQANTLSVDEAAHAQTADNVVLDVGGTLAIQDADHAHTADNVDLIQANTLVIQEALHGHSSDNVDLVQANVLAIGDAIHTHTVGNVVLVAGITLTVQDAAHAHTADNVALTQANILAIQNALHAHTSENLDLSQANVLIVSDSLHAHIADNIALSIPLGFDIVTPDIRVFVIAAQDRNFVIVKQDRSFVIQKQDRSFVIQ